MKKLEELVRQAKAGNKKAIKRLLTYFGMLALFATLAAAQTNPCVGTPQPKHCNIITVLPATQPAGVTIVKWNLYKAATAGGYVMGTPFLTNLVGVLIFQDNNVVSNQTNHYALTAYSADQKESPFSNNLVSTTPTDPPGAPGISIQTF